MIAGDPWQGGAAWAILQYVLGFSDLGFEVVLIEPLQAKSLRPAGASLEQSENAAYFRAVTEAFGLGRCSSLVLDGARESIGLPYDELHRISGRAVAVINVSGMLQYEDLISRIPCRVYLDLDPAFNQLWHETQGIDMRFQAHNCFVTVGNAVGRAGCTVPTCGLEWMHTLQPVLLRHWPAATEIVYNGLTTVANWRGYGSIHCGDVQYGQKAHSLREFIDLPTRTPEQFLLALNIHPGEENDLRVLAGNGWRLLDPLQVAGTPGRYGQFIRGSKAEFGIAKSGYVASQCGWFSDRSACYLASGRPVIAQDTGFSRFLPCGEGLLRFSTRDEALAAVEDVSSNYARHARAAREIAEEYFDSFKVLSRLAAAIEIN
jgi:hypothetical protein